MKRSSFLKHSLGLVAGAALGSRIPLEPAVAVAEAAPVVEAAATGLPYSIIKAGGLCAPLTPYYDLPGPSWTTARPVRDSLPSFAAKRGDIRFDS